MTVAGGWRCFATRAAGWRMIGGTWYAILCTMHYAEQIEEPSSGDTSQLHKYQAGATASTAAGPACRKRPRRASWATCAMAARPRSCPPCTPAPVSVLFHPLSLSPHLAAELHKHKSPSPRRRELLLPLPRLFLCDAPNPRTAQAEKFLKETHGSDCFRRVCVRVYRQGERG